MSGASKRKSQSSNAPPPKKIKKSEDISCDVTWDLNETLADKVGCPVTAVVNVVDMLDNDCTIPFIARYRKEKTENMEVEKLREVKEELDGLREVQKKISTVMKTLIKSEQLSEDVSAALKNSQTLTEVEQLYAPYKPGSKKTLAARAKEAGLEPLALNLIKNPRVANIQAAVDRKSKDRSTLSDVMKGVQHIIADLISKDKTVMDTARSKFSSAFIQLEVSKARNSKKDDQKFKENISKFENYIDTKHSVKSIRAHQVMAINRGEVLKVLSVKFNVPDAVPKEISRVALKNFLHPKTNVEQRKLVEGAVDDAYSRLIQPLMLRHIRKDISKRAERESIEVFASNLKRLLLVPPVRGKVVLGLDPGFRNGCKYAITSPNGSVLSSGVSYLHGNGKSKQNSEMAKLVSLLKQHNCSTVAIGNGTACRETEQVLSEHISAGAFQPLLVKYCIVNEAGASIYSASSEAIKEMPDLDVSIRGAVSIARRLQDPLAELVKIDPKHIGVGMYQHDIAENQLRTALDDVVEECVNFVGVDLNFCSETILRRIAGLSQSKAEKIVAWRETNKGFINRDQLKKVKGLGPKTFEQCAGFKSGVKTVTYEPEPLDMTNIHPESYSVADKVIKKSGLDKSNIGQSSFIQHFQKWKEPSALQDLANEFNIGLPTMSLIIDGLCQPIGHDFRDEFTKPLFREGMTSFSDLKSGMKLTGRVVNRTHFGAFVDIGVGTDGLVHTSNMPAVDQRGAAALQLGDRVQVQLLSVDANRKRIGLKLVSVL
ncbi:hypothetical protein CAPTEDRAFT_175688 [Capitella teleta]|uniref:S1 motif domain-containing protein n=1 Tax=Capitella teleta TaxID=283909 RepID=R7T5V6_CAPTE|nr:hypothetical protein CAPTEDRAFT_175688 [Capitella teleta]|eukprot:ELT88700.1 hypothetical protein CAPTEDRAFT_175688 [Capitella teleta]